MTEVWLSIAAVARRVGRSDDIVRERMAETPPHIAKPWINISTAKRPEWQFTNDAAVDQWWEELHRWRASESAAESGRSDGASPATASTSSSAATPSRGRRTPTRFSRSSAAAKSSAADTSPRSNVSTFNFLPSVKA